MDFRGTGLVRDTQIPAVVVGHIQPESIAGTDPLGANNYGHLMVRAAYLVQGGVERCTFGGADGIGLARCELEGRIGGGGGVHQILRPACGDDTHPRYWITQLSRVWGIAPQNGPSDRRNRSTYRPYSTKIGLPKSPTLG